MTPFNLIQLISLVNSGSLGDENWRTHRWRLFTTWCELRYRGLSTREQWYRLYRLARSIRNCHHPEKRRHEMTTTSTYNTVYNALFDIANVEIVPTHVYSEATTPTGLHVMFRNGLILSVQWHKGAYSSVGRNELSDDPTYETAVWYTDSSNRVWFNPRTGAPHSWDDGDDQVQGNQTLGEVVATARIVANLQSPIRCN
jgi:hypothetical protein